MVEAISELHRVVMPWPMAHCKATSEAVLSQDQCNKQFKDA
jgi:hypothetical protein